MRRIGPYVVPLAIIMVSLAVAWKAWPR